DPAGSRLAHLLRLVLRRERSGGEAGGEEQEPGGVSQHRRSSRVVRGQAACEGFRCRQSYDRCIKGDSGRGTGPEPPPPGSARTVPAAVGTKESGAGPPLPGPGGGAEPGEAARSPGGAGRRPRISLGTRPTLPVVRIPAPRYGAARRQRARGGAHRTGALRTRGRPNRRQVTMKRGTIGAIAAAALLAACGKADDPAGAKGDQLTRAEALVIVDAIAMATNEDHTAIIEGGASSPAGAAPGTITVEHTSTHPCPADGQI